MRSSLDVIISCIKPTAYIKAWDVFERLKFSPCRTSHAVAIKMLLIQWRLQCIIHKRASMPGSVCFIYFHVIHLYRKEDIQGWVPGRFVNLFTDRKRICSLVSIFNVIDSGFSNIGEIEFYVIVSEMFSPLG